MEICAGTYDRTVKMALTMGNSRPLFVYFRPFQTAIHFKLKKHRCCGWDLNPGPQDGRRRRTAKDVFTVTKGST